MKILELRFKNLNSLYGEWVVDFTRPEYLLDGIFVITGPTGAGKSTILDAICLALYGRTPRLKSISTNTNEIMSRQTGECFAQVIFETGSGRFQCHWGQHKARKKPDGNLIDSKHEISDVKTGKILESRKRDVAARVEKETGMDFQRFTRSMMLAQGGFAAFLEAAPDERAPILEQITGTKIYSEISKLVHERKSTENRKLELLQAQTAGIAVLNDEEETAVTQELTSKQEIENRENKKNENLGKSIFVLERIKGLEKELKEINEKSDELSKDFKDFEPEREKLNNALKASELASEYAGLLSKREQQEQEIKVMESSRVKIPTLEKDLDIKEKNHKKTEENTAHAKENLKKESLTIQKVRELDLTISQKQSLLKTAISDCKDTQTRILQKTDEQNKIKSIQKTADKNLNAIEKYLSSCSNDSMLVSQLTGIRVQIQSFENLLTDLRAMESQEIKIKKQLDKSIKLHKKQTALCSKHKGQHDLAQHQVLKTTNSVKELLKGRMLREYQSEYNNLLKEMVYLNKIASLEDERTKLADNKPCPLCGALEHPFASGNVPGIDQTQEKIDQLSDLIEKIENLNMELEKNKTRERKKEISLMEAEKELARALYKRDELQANVNSLAVQIDTASQKHVELQNRLLSNLQPFGIMQISESDIKSISGLLETRLKKWQEKESQKREIKEKLNEQTSMLKGLDAVLKTLNASLKEREDLVESHKKDLEEIKKERKKLYGKKDPDNEEARLETLVVKAENAEKTSRRNRDDMKHSLDELRVRVTALEESTGRRKFELDDLESRFKVSMDKRGFKNEKIFILNRLSSEQRASLDKKAKQLDAAKADIASHKKDRKTRLSKEKEKKIIQQPLDILQKEQEQISTSLTTLGQEIGAIKHKLADNKDAKKKIEEKTDLINAQKKECTRWDALHLLIGSADGKKFRNFAQGLTFELMVSHANLQLEKMSDRYLLIRDRKQPLELNIVDNFQAGEIRSTKNLSGGESFVVSLALALGLSNMASRNVRVDSLFLDEGFGTLDEDALETSLEALAGLHQRGKLIGVISHVSALKQRIATQINIMPLSGGKSRITGPGCKSAV